MKLFMQQFLYRFWLLLLGISFYFGLAEFYE
ncbi:unnamed protein product [Gongylonema pulchrum]|uniref:Uncharacterized protein n=1 Tax=Gongylonema pulchrum TaxID=637853 RepID=A0A3P7RVB0_9BILA|nr:unnamed protein product [Gongylonema pulchrum]